MKKEFYIEPRSVTTGRHQEAGVYVKSVFPACYFRPLLAFINTNQERYDWNT